MIAAILLQAAVAGLGTLPQQVLPSKGCAAYLWSMSDRRLVAMAGAEPAFLRILLDSVMVDVPHVSESGSGDYGFAGTIVYGAGDLAATLEMTVMRRADLSAGAAVPSGTLTVTRTGQDSLIVPVAGLIGCAG